jgi:hypothetical protein
MENRKRTSKTNFTIRPAWMIIWTMSLPKALSNEMPTGICVINGIVIIVTSAIA